MKYANKDSKNDLSMLPMAPIIINTPHSGATRHISLSTFYKAFYNKQFSWCNGHLDNTRREVRLDRSYINNSLAQKEGSTGLAVHISYVSDHSTHFLTLGLVGRGWSKAHLRFNQRTLQYNMDDLVRTWKTQIGSESDWKEKIKQIMQLVKLIRAFPPAWQNAVDLELANCRGIRFAKRVVGGASAMAS